MRRISSAAIALVALLASSLGAQTLLQEDWSTAAGLTPPAGWSATKVASSGQIAAPWRFDNPGGRTPGAPFAGLFAICDTDQNGPASQGTSTLRSPFFDASTSTMPTLHFDQQFRDLTSGWSIDVFDGSVWNTVAFQTNNTVNANIGWSTGNTSGVVSTQYDVTAAAGASAAAQLRFVHQYNWDWWWAIDNVLVLEPQPTPGQAPRPGLAVFDINGATNINQAPVSSGLGGPYFTSVTQGTMMSMSFEGGASQAIAVVYGVLNPVSASYPGGIGQFDVGGPGVDMNGIPLNLGVFANGIGWAQGGFVGLPFDAMFFTDATGTGLVSFLFPNFNIPSGQNLTTFQAAITASASPFVYLSNAVDVTIN